MDLGYYSADGHGSPSELPAASGSGEKSARSALDTWTRALGSIKLNEAGRWTTLLSVVREVAGDAGDRPALVGEGSRLTYREFVELSDAYSNWVLEQELDDGEVVGLLMPNCPDYVAIWCGISETGRSVALLNTSLVGEALSHAIRTSGSSRIIVASSLHERLVPIVGEHPGLRVLVHGQRAEQDLPRIDLTVQAWLGRPPGPLDRAPTRGDRALLIGTSGTTGLPKAANVTHARVLEWSFWFAGLMDVRSHDRLYNCLPMYHSIGGVVAIGSILSRGGCVVIRERFSAHRFWEDIVESECTIFQYIGELCRYLNNSPVQDFETKHRLRLCCGNGLRPEVWTAFRDRFAIPDILEFYAATEGNVSLYNCEAKPGAIGRLPAFLKHRFPVELIRIDGATGEPVRDVNGFCVRCSPDEPGEALGLIDRSKSSSSRRFDGYTDPEASARKTLGNVFSAGDLWFRTGDLLRRDGAGFFYFVDRLGDTFRWKGENVSTSEVSEVIGRCAGVREAVVFGVSLPGFDGRVGMAAITRTAAFSFYRLQQHLSDHLPHYARPAFVRLCDTLETTGTFKFVKSALIEEGLSVASATGELWFLDQRTDHYVRCDDNLLDQIRDGTLRV